MHYNDRMADVIKIYKLKYNIFFILLSHYLLTIKYHNIIHLTKNKISCLKPKYVYYRILNLRKEISMGNW